MNFLSNYLLYASANEAPTIYHQWSALSSISHLIGPRVWTHMGGNLFFFPNMYVNLVGDPGLKKSTAMKQAQKLVESVKTIAQSPASISVEALVQLMAREGSPCKKLYQYEGKSVNYTQLSIFANEIVSLLNASGNPAGMIEFLTDIWDRSGGEYQQTFKNKGDNLIVRPYVTILGCLTPDTIKSLVASKVVGSGMSRRCLFVTATSNSEPRDFINVTSEQQAAWKECHRHAQDLQKIAGQFSWAPAAKAFYSEWYKPFTASIPKVQSPTLKLFYMSKPEYTIKTSMLLSLCQFPPVLEHQLDTFKQALAMISQIEDGAVKLFESTGRNELSTIAQDVERYFSARSNETIPYSVVKVQFWKDLKSGDEQELVSILTHLVETGKLEQTNKIESAGITKYYTHKK